MFDLRIVTTPGHTAGHIAVLDEVGGLMVAGDALGTSNGAPRARTRTSRTIRSPLRRSLAKLGKLTFETLLVGHGEPILTGASAQVAALPPADLARRPGSTQEAWWGGLRGSNP